MNAAVTVDDSDRSEDPDCLPIGRLLGARYRVMTRLGAGGMGSVYAAENIQLGLRVAIKTVNRDRLGSATLHRRFRREARVGAMLQHPNLVRVFDFDQNGGEPFLVMELLEGTDLRRLLQVERVLPVARAVEIMREVLAGLSAAHAHGIVHRDLKPANIFLESGSSRTRVLDFGVAKLASEDSASAEPLTVGGGLVGTVAYMAPEQIRGAADADPRVDVYAASAILFEMITGQRPFESESVPQQIFRALHESPPNLRAMAPHCGPKLAALVNSGLSSQRAKRFADAGEMLIALDACVERSVRPRPRPRRPAAAALLLFGTVVGIGPGYWLGASHTSSSAAASPVARASDRVQDPLFSSTIAEAAPPQSVSAVLAPLPPPSRVKQNPTLTRSGPQRMTSPVASSSASSSLATGWDVERANPYD